MTDEEMNRRVAVAMGWEVRQGATGWRWFREHLPVSDSWPSSGSAERHVPDFCRDPAAADLVRLEIERRGGTILEVSEPGKARGSRRYYANVDLGTFQPSTESTKGRGHALCLAFLAASHAADNDTDRAGDGSEGG